jgi:hypothetical protein
MPGDDKSLLERIELPSIPQEARSKIGRVQEALERAELEQSKCFTLSHRIRYFRRRIAIEFEFTFLRQSVGPRAVLIQDERQPSLQLTRMWPITRCELYFYRLILNAYVRWKKKKKNTTDLC